MKPWREQRIEQTIQKHDRMLFLQKNFRGELQVMRRSTHGVHYDINGTCLINYEPRPHYIMSLTKDWTGKTEPVDWGLEPIMRRLQEIDGWNHDIAARVFDHNDRVKKQKDQSLKNKTEDFVREELRPRFAKATEDILTHSVARIDSRRKRDKNGRYKS